MLVSDVMGQHSAEDGLEVTNDERKEVRVGPYGPLERKERRGKGKVLNGPWEGYSRDRRRILGVILTRESPDDEYPCFFSRGIYVPVEMLCKEVIL